ncbi:MAG: hypothetical protein R2713_00465 [Ilumatobacteraceae bacterium]
MPSSESPISAVLWDFGGVILSSPFEAFNHYERNHHLPPDFIRGVNATNPHDNAWARLERSDITAAEFDVEFAAESEALGHRVPGADVLALLSGEVRPEMLRALDRVIDAGYRTACLTNNVSGEHGRRSGARRSQGSWRVSTTWSRAARSAAANPSRASTRSPANCSGSPRPSVCSSTTSASTSSRPRPWACARSRCSPPIRRSPNSAILALDLT